MTYYILSDEAVSFVRRTPRNNHCAILTIITGQLQVPRRIRHYTTCTNTHPKWKDLIKSLCTECNTGLKCKLLLIKQCVHDHVVLTALWCSDCDHLIAFVHFAEALSENFDVVGGIWFQQRQCVAGLVAVGVHDGPLLCAHKPGYTVMWYGWLKSDTVYIDLHELQLKEHSVGTRGKSHL